MKLADKLNILNRSKETRKMVTCYFTYDASYVHYYVLDVNEKFVCAAEEFDFMIKGYEIRKISRLQKCRMRNDKTDEINEIFGVTRQIEFLNINLSNWRSIFKYLHDLDDYVELECCNDGTCYYGKILKVNRSSILFWDFDADGVWQEPIEIPFKDIDGVVWDSWYLNGWQDYFENK